MLLSLFGTQATGTRQGKGWADRMRLEEGGGRRRRRREGGYIQEKKKKQWEAGEGKEEEGEEEKENKGQRGSWVVKRSWRSRIKESTVYTPCYRL